MELMTLCLSSRQIAEGRERTETERHRFPTQREKHTKSRDFQLERDQKGDVCVLSLVDILRSAIMT